MDQERMWLLAARKFSKEATPEELQELEEMFRKYPDVQYAYLLINELKESTGAHDVADEQEMKTMQERGLRQWRAQSGDIYPWERIRKKNRYGIAKMLALTFFLVLVAGYMLFTETSREERAGVALETHEIAPKIYKASETSSVVLQDGTKVWLNRGSTLRCSDGFGVKNRETYLQGEAFFEVVANAQRPFIVHAGEWMDIRVLGTEFNVKAYPGDPYVETLLTSGKLVVNIKKSDKKEVVLKPLQKVTWYTREDAPAAQEPIKEPQPRLQISEIKRNTGTQTIAETAWMEDKLAFNDLAFGELAYDLERIYHKKIEFRDEAIRAYHLTGEFKTEDINQVLKALQITTPFHYVISDRVITITR